MGLPGSARLHLVSDTVLLSPEATVFTAMLDGWADQQRARFLQVATIQARIGVVQRFADYTGEYPWNWQADDVDAWFASLNATSPPTAVSTARGYQGALRLFCGFITDSRYGWKALCEQRFGSIPVQVLHEWNVIAHVSEFEGRQGRRPLTYDEVQALFDAADGRAEHAATRHRKGACTALRDAAFLKTVYAFGLRRREAVSLDLADLRSNPKIAAYGRYGGVFVRAGKSSRGGAPKRRTVLTVPEMDWIVEVLECYLGEVRPRLLPGSHPGLWVTERCGRLSVRSANLAFTEAREAAGLPSELDLHSLRHSYVTHLMEFGYPEKFVQDQVGHCFASTTAIYSHVSDEFRNRLVVEALAKRGITFDEEA